MARESVREWVAAWALGWAVAWVPESVRELPLGSAEVLPVRRRESLLGSAEEPKWPREREWTLALEPKSTGEWLLAQRVRRLAPIPWAPQSEPRPARANRWKPPRRPGRYSTLSTPRWALPRWTRPRMRPGPEAFLESTP